MKHSLTAEGFGVRLRPVRLDDAAFIVWLRNLAHAIGRVGDSAADVTGQQQWLEKYFNRDGDYYFIVETPAGNPVGTYSLYNRVGSRAEAGRWIMRPGVTAALPSGFVLCEIAFNQLQLSELVGSTVATNQSVLSLNRKLGWRQTRIEPAAQIINGQPADFIHFVKSSTCPKSRTRAATSPSSKANRHVPFAIKRVFYLYDVPGGAERAGHALKKCHQFLIAMSGSFDVVVYDGKDKQRFHLNRSYYGLHLPPMIWREMDNFSSGSVCLALASESYDEKDYFRDYREYLRGHGRRQRVKVPFLDFTGPTKSLRPNWMKRTSASCARRGMFWGRKWRRLNRNSPPIARPNIASASATDWKRCI
jgi:RimJ/RimL family protein N-acetyltransferase